MVIKRILLVALSLLTMLAAASCGSDDSSSKNASVNEAKVEAANEKAEHAYRKMNEYVQKALVEGFYVPAGEYGDTIATSGATMVHAPSAAPGQSELTEAMNVYLGKDEDYKGGYWTAVFDDRTLVSLTFGESKDDINKGTYPPKAD